MRRARWYLGSAAALGASVALAVSGCAAARQPGTGDTTGAVTASPAAAKSRSPASGKRSRSPATPNGKGTVGTSGLCSSRTHPELAAQMSRSILAALHGRQSVVAIAAADPDDGVSCAYHQWWEFDSASIVKAIILGALLYELQPGHHYLSGEQIVLTKQMITYSDNDAATALWNEVGRTNLQRFLTAAKMDHTELGPTGYWGLTDVNAHDEMLLLRLLVSPDSILNKASRSYELGLMADVIPGQRWGVPAGAPADVTSHLKNGWLQYPSLWIINSIGDFTRHDDDDDYSIAVLTKDNPDMQYGIDTVQSVAEVINKSLGSIGA
jgi:Beta-lactamase enzyme family